MDLSHIATRLQAARLVLEVELSSHGPVVEQLDTAIRAHNKMHDIHFGPPADEDSLTSVEPAGSDPSAVDWILCAPKARSGASAKLYVADTKGLTKFTFTAANLRSAPWGATTPNHLTEGSTFLFVGKSTAIPKPFFLVMTNAFFKLHD